MSGNNINRIFLARLAGTAVFDPNGDPVGKVRDAVATLRSNNQSPRILGLVVEVPLRRRVFVPITRVTSIESGGVVITGLLNMRRFETRAGEMLVLGDLLDRTITLLENNEDVLVEDMGMEQNRTGDWLITRVHIMRKGRGLRRKGATSTVAWEEVTGFAQHESNQGVSNLLSTLSNLRAADLAAVIQDLAPKRRVEVARALDDERLADVLEEMDESERVALLAELEGERAADVLEEMDPDDAADLLREIGEERAQELIGLMDPEDAEDVLRLMTYEDYSAGGMMTTEPIVMSADYTVADALAAVRQSEISPALASQVFIARQPLETPTGRFIGMVHYQRLLREPPSTLLGSIVDTNTQGVNPDASLHAVSSYLASYNLLSLPVIDANDRLLGAVTVDDVLDHLLPENWRHDHRDSAATTAALESIDTNFAENFTEEV
ncbi:Mg/Co/Ni transporter MgtE [Candidatus Planktophila sulfonica]|jgi:CBS domain-containing protein|uniref:Mg/Co/Ni transporter MgtE n=1 Tax=Candidatus Planktophila sulfonica TaxID=1884904 RepID=A0A249KHH6_9ACTN|nr:CBS domain-containing protein [Candidatus Planktophila sulfonica]ASY16260.1 Mg/Co/Ni transporter MgtE [Candidatus Planktophila sulfonica]